MVQAKLGRIWIFLMYVDITRDFKIQKPSRQSSKRKTFIFVSEEFFHFNGRRIKEDEGYL